MLLEALQHPEPGVRKAAVDSLAQRASGNGIVIRALLGALGEKDDQVRVAAIDALASLGKAAASALSVLVRIFRDGNETEQERAAAALEALGPAGQAAQRQILKERRAPSGPRLPFPPPRRKARCGSMATASRCRPGPWSAWAVSACATRASAAWPSRGMVRHWPQRVEG